MDRSYTSNFKIEQLTDRRGWSSSIILAMVFMWTGENYLSPSLEARPGAEKQSV